MTESWIEDTVDLVGHHRILHQVTYYESAMEGPVWECRCGERSEKNTLPDLPAAQREGRRHTDTAILAALAEAGLLLQPGGEMREEFLCGKRPGPGRHYHRCPDATHVRTVHSSPWAPVEGGAS